MESNTQNRTLALAALFQCVEGVNQLASKGRVEPELLESCINSILQDADTLAGLYGGVDALRTGLQTLLYQLGGNTLTPDGRPKNMETTRYSINILYLENKLHQNPDTFSRLMTGIGAAQAQLEFFEPTHPNMIARLAELYTDTISKVGPRIIIKGEQTHLSNPDTAARIRVLLLAGIRAALLWRQAGGNRWRLFFARGAMQDEARRLLA
ncbi:MAG: high frequency lysogenization protein HflD [Thiothrix sp.]|nr:high frequency lysogenization protein HflD [Thiothrix sp.]